MFKAIVNVDTNWAIGNKGQLLFPIKEDLKYFAQLTTGKVIIMGRKTLESLPGGKPLPKRENIVLTSQNLSHIESQHENLVACNSIDEIKTLLKTPRYGAYKNIFIIGGQSIYEQFLNDCDTVYVTQVQATAMQSDAFFPNLDTLTDWKLSDSSKSHAKDDIFYRYLVYRRC